MTLSVYFNNNDKLLSGQDECTTVFPVERTVPYTVGVGKAALEELLKGSTADEQSQGYSTSIKPGVVLNSLKIENGIGYADFNDALDEGVAGSCLVTMIRSQITQTLKQFPTVEEVVISINGESEEVLQP